MNTEQPLPTHLQRIGEQLVLAAERLQTSGAAPPRRWPGPRRGLTRLARGPRILLAGGLAGLATAAAVIAMFSGATPAAYAVTEHPNGTVTITINDIHTGVPALNAKLEQLGFPATAVPITATCPAPAGSDGPAPITRIKVSLSPSLTTHTAAGLIELTRGDIPAGSEGVIAAYRTPAGRIDLSFATTTGRVPACLNLSQFVASPTASTPGH